MSRPVSRVRRIIEISVAAVALVIVFVWVQGLMGAKVGPDDGHGSTGARYEGPAAAVESREIPVLVEAIGTVRAVNEAMIASRVMGVIEKILVDEGDRVVRGQELIVISAAELTAKREAAKQAVAAAEAALLQARGDFERMEGLLAKDAATKVEWEHARTQLSVAEADLSRAREGARAEGTMASYARLTAPFSGVIVERRMDPGDLASPGSPLLRLIDDGSFQLEAVMDEAAAAALAEGAPVLVVLGTGLDGELQASISDIVPATDPLSRTVLVKASLPRVEGLNTGQFGRLRFTTGSRSSLVIPAGAVHRVGGLDLVHVLDAQGNASTRYVRLGGAVGSDAVEILSGLAEGERVALEPVVRHE